jgi:hypothetical protein
MRLKKEKQTNMQTTQAARKKRGHAVVGGFSFFFLPERSKESKARAVTA